MALDYSVIKKMRKFTSLALADEFFEQYKYEYEEERASLTFLYSNPKSSSTT